MCKKVFTGHSLLCTKCVFSINSYLKPIVFLEIFAVCTLWRPKKLRHGLSVGVLNGHFTFETMARTILRDDPEKPRLWLELLAFTKTTLFFDTFSGEHFLTPLRIYWKKWHFDQKTRFWWFYHFLQKTWFLLFLIIFIKITWFLSFLS